MADDLAGVVRELKVLGAELRLVLVDRKPTEDEILRYVHEMTPREIIDGITEGLDEAAARQRLLAAATRFLDFDVSEEGL